MQAVDYQILSRIDQIECSQRLARLRDRFFSEGPRGCGDRAEIAAQSWEETVGEPLEIRRAKLVRKVLEEIPVTIWNDELTVGSWGKYFRSANPFIDWDAEYFLNIREGENTITFGGPAEKGVVEKDDLEKILRAMGVFKGQTPAEKIKEFRQSLCGEWYEDLVEARGTLRFEGSPMSPAKPQWEKIFEKGLKGIMQEAKAKLDDIQESKEDDPENFYFLQAVIITLEGLVNFAKRYGKAARENALSEKDPKRRTELEKIAEICETISESPPRTFWEALQLYRFVVVGCFLEHPIYALYVGRADQFFYPYFKNDLGKGLLTLAEATELVGDAVSWEARLQHIRQVEVRDFVQANIVRQYTLGGVTKTGGDACQELTYLFLHIAGLLKYASPQFGLRWHANIPKRFMQKAAETNCKVKGGVPMFVNDEHIIGFINDKEIPLEDARDWFLVGCSHPIPSCIGHECQLTYLDASFALELVLHNGFSSVTGKKIGIDTGDPRQFKTFEEVYEAWRAQHEYISRRLLWSTRFSWKVLVQNLRQPLNSAFAPNCIEECTDWLVRVEKGGKPYPIWYAFSRNFVNVANSLVAIKKLVFENGKCTMEELFDAIDADFTGDKNEEIRQMCLAAPKFGNDIDEVDYLLRDLGRFSASVVRSEKTVSGNFYCTHRNGVAYHYYAGKGIGALPDGRKARTPLADGALSPMTGTDQNGPTALMRSVLKADFTHAACPILNMKFPLNLLQTQEIFDKFVALTDSFFRQGGIHVQYNIFDKELYVEAKKHPEKYKDLVVRVAGYSAYFVNLVPEVQDEIIARTEQWI